VRAALRDHLAVWIDVEPELAWSRCRGTGRPLAADREAFFRLYASREPLYSELADVVVPRQCADMMAEVLESLSGVPSGVRVLWAASSSATYPAYIGPGLLDPDRFWPDPTGPAEELLFVANSRKIQRRIVADLAGTEHDLSVYGHGWTSDLINLRFVKGDLIPNADLRRHYSSAKIVLNDHWDDMRAEGFISNRIYDAVACGAFVISDHVDGIEEEFGGAVVTYREAAELEPLIGRYLADGAERKRLGELGRDIVVERHTFDQRAGVLQDVVDGLGVAGRLRILDRTLAQPS
jgi:hypothetical protein